MDNTDLDAGYFNPRPSIYEVHQRKMRENESHVKINTDSAHYENSGIDEGGYLKPASKYQNVQDDKNVIVPSLDEALTIEGQKEQHDRGGSTLVVCKSTHPAEGYISLDELEKSMSRANAPQGNLHQSSNPEYENTKDERRGSAPPNKNNEEKETIYQNALYPDFVH